MNFLIFRRTLSYTSILSCQALIYDHDQEWNEWESSFEEKFWMTIDERKEKSPKILPDEESKEKVEEISLDIDSKDFNEKMAVGALFDMFSSNMLDSKEGDDMNLEPMDINDDPVVIDTMLPDPSNKFNEANHHSSTSEVNVIQQKSGENLFSNENLKALTTKNVIEDDTRERQEEEQLAMLNANNGNSILNFTVRKQRGINQTEINISKNNTEEKTSKSKKGSQKSQKSKKQRKKRKLNNDQNSKETSKKVC